MLLTITRCEPDGYMLLLIRYADITVLESLDIRHSQAEYIYIYIYVYKKAPGIYSKTDFKQNHYQGNPSLCRQILIATVLVT